MPIIDRRAFVSAAAAGRAGRRPPRPGARSPSAAEVPEASGRTWRVDAARLKRRLKDLSRFGANPQGGVSRVAFSPADVEGRAFVMEMMRAAGLGVRIDRRRQHPRPPAPACCADAPPILFGSHIDSVPEGGNYDGDVGSMAAIEVRAGAGRERRTRNRHPLEVAIWCDEESGLTGSRALRRRPRRRGARACRPATATLLGENIRRIGGDPDRLAEARHAKGSVAAYLELHIEQGGTLDARRRSHRRGGGDRRHPPLRGDAARLRQPRGHHARWTSGATRCWPPPSSCWPWTASCGRCPDGRWARSAAWPSGRARPT